MIFFLLACSNNGERSNQSEEVTSSVILPSDDVQIKPDTSNMIRVYVAGPYSKGDVAQNVRRAFEAGNKLADLGFAPFVPHSTHFWHMLFPRPYKFWLNLDNQFIPLCDALIRLPGDSGGSDKEVALAKKNNIPVFYSVDSLSQYFGDQSHFVLKYSEEELKNILDHSVNPHK